MHDAKEEVRARLAIEDVIGEYVQLKRAGRNFKGLSPFNQEKTPSFVVSPDKQIWHDFSSGRGGDVFSFVMEVEGLDFRASLELLARKAGVDLSLYDSGGAQEIVKKRRRLLEANELAAKYYQQSLLKNQHALEYVFKTRRLDKPTVAAFRIGYAPASGDGLRRFLTKKGFTSTELAEAGLTNRFGGDLFRGRMMVPLMDAAGQVIGFTARIIVPDDKAPKYLNTPQTLLYDKSRHVFGLHLAKEAIRQADYAVVVEGNMDVISSHQANVKQVVATAGTAMTEPQIKSLVRLSQNVRLAYDGDQAGLAATERAIPIAARVGAELTIVSLPGEYKDPDELIQADAGAWLETTKQARPAVDWVISQYKNRLDLKTAAGKRQFSSEVLEVVGQLPDPVEQEHYYVVVAKILNSSVEAIKTKAQQAESTEEAKPLRQVKSSGPVERDQYLYQDDLLAAALTEPTASDLFAETDPAMFVGGARQAVASYLASRPELPVGDTPASLNEHDSYVKMLLLRAEERYSDFDSFAKSQEIATLLRRMETEHKKKLKQQLQAELLEAEANYDEARQQVLLQQITNLDKEINSARR